MSSYGVFIYTFAQSIHLSMIFSQAFLDVEELSTSLKGKNRELESLHTIDLAIASSVDQNRLLEVILEEALARLGMDAADILLFDEKEEFLSLGARVGFRSEALIHTHLRPGDGFAGRALESGQALIIADLDENADGFGRSPAFASEGFFFYAGRSLRVKGKIVGVLETYRRSPFRHYPSWELYFQTLAGQAAVALDNSSLLQGLRRANEELREANVATIEGWAQALELRDRETEGHSRRVTDMTTDLGRRFGIAGADLDRLRYGALLHDIGKMGVPDSILLKPGPLSEEEFQVMKRHPAIARELLSRLRFLEQSLDIPYCHHEKWDGSGYPRGLAGNAIPLSARLFAVVDVWDALCSDRPYRAAWPEERVLEHIASLAGSHFDPAIAAAFIALRRA
jgi:HD-GYP domain-containing protein (c-di-GMP phosphodiesterase class II)